MVRLLAVIFTAVRVRLLPPIGPSGRDRAGLLSGFDTVSREANAGWSFCWGSACDAQDTRGLSCENPLRVLPTQLDEMFQKLQLHVLGVPPPKLRREGRCAVVFPVRERNVGEEEVRLFVVRHRGEAGFSFRGLAAQK